MKTSYSEPTTDRVTIRHTGIICASKNLLTGISSDADLNSEIPGDDDTARARQHDGTAQEFPAGRMICQHHDFLFLVAV